MKTKRQRAYIEITNRCNLKCHFCPQTIRSPEDMTPEFFASLLPQLKPFARELFFHVMGEPTLHPELKTFLDLAHEAHFKVNLTTNGTHLIHTLFHPAIRQINFSLQSITHLERLDQLLLWLETATQIRPDCFYNLRLWNHHQNVNHEPFLKCLAQFYHLEIQQLKFDQIHHQVKLKKNIFLHHQSLFSWPKIDPTVLTPQASYCLGLIDQFAILSNGIVTACCLDSQGTIALGNSHTQSLKSILNSPRALAMIEGFTQQKNIEKLCQHCTYRLRFLED